MNPYRENAQIEPERPMDLIRIAKRSIKHMNSNCPEALCMEVKTIFYDFRPCEFKCVYKHDAHVMITLEGTKWELCCKEHRNNIERIKELPLHWRIMARLICGKINKSMDRLQTIPLCQPELSWITSK